MTFRCLLFKLLIVKTSLKEMAGTSVYLYLRFNGTDELPELGPPVPPR